MYIICLHNQNHLKLEKECFFVYFIGLVFWLCHFWSCWFDLLIFVCLFKEDPFPPDRDNDLEQGAILAYFMSCAFLAEEKKNLLNELV